MKRHVSAHGLTCLKDIQTTYVHGESNYDLFLCRHVWLQSTPLPMVQPKPAKRAKHHNTSSIAASPAIPHLVSDPNIEWNAVVQDALLVITTCNVFGDSIVTEEALGQKDGFLHPWTPELFHNMPDAKMVGPCGVNALWCSPTFSIAPGVPTSKESVKRLQRVRFPNNQPRTLQSIIDFVYPRKRESIATCVLRRISPEEPVQALVLTIAQRIKEKASTDELKELQVVLLQLNLMMNNISICKTCVGKERRAPRTVREAVPHSD